MRGRYGALFFGRHADVCPYEHGQAGLSHGRWEDLY